MISGGKKIASDRVAVLEQKFPFNYVRPAERDHPLANQKILPVVGVRFGFPDASSWHFNQLGVSFLPASHIKLNGNSISDRNRPTLANLIEIMFNVFQRRHNSI